MNDICKKCGRPRKCSALDCDVCECGEVFPNLDDVYEPKEEK